MFFEVSPHVGVIEARVGALGKANVQSGDDESAPRRGVKNAPPVAEATLRPCQNARLAGLNFEHLSSRPHR